MSTSTTEIRAEVREDIDGIPEVIVASDGDATMGQLKFQASQALDAYRLSQLKAPFPGDLLLVAYGQALGQYVTTYRPERLV